MKYIVTEDENGVEEIFIFPHTVHHDVMAEAVSRLKDQSHGNWERIDRDVIAAGFTDGVTCWGYSDTLSLISRYAVDALLIKE